MRKVIIFAGCTVLILILGWAVWSLATASGEYDEFAKCLTSKGVIMAGTDWCHVCQAQKALFGPSFRYIDYRNCDIGTFCDEQGITAYPTWIINGEKYRGKQPLSRLAELSGCSL